jgi:formyl-CoA transferase
VPAGKLGTIPDAVALAEALGLDPLVEIGDGYAPQIRHPVRWTTYRTATPTPPPALGEHDAAVRAWLATPSTPVDPKVTR